MIRLIDSLKVLLRWIYVPVLKRLEYYKELPTRQAEIKRLEEIKPGEKRIFYLGITEHTNLGDMAQHYCIKNWISQNYPDFELVMFGSKIITDPKFTNKFLTVFSKKIGSNDRIVFQSGYCTQDLGGDHTLMHKIICDHFPNARILMMPQTIYFQNEENRRLCADNHNKAKKMLFLARDFVSYEQAKLMFPDIMVRAYPDIVTTMIGTRSFNCKRNGVCLCTRNDSEKLYSDNEIVQLAENLRNKGIEVLQKDTQGDSSVKEIREKLQLFIEQEIESYSKFEVTITDRYHGTIFSLCAGTPVIIIKTTDHKVTTGADWFKGVYDDFVYVASDLNDAYNISLSIIKEKRVNQLKPYFKEKYYDKLKELFESL